MYIYDHFLTIISMTLNMQQDSREFKYYIVVIKRNKKNHDNIQYIIISSFFFFKFVAMKKRMKCEMADSKMCDSYNLWIEA